VSAEGQARPGGELVVVGSSAGGVGALSIFVSTLPRDFAAPVVLAQHLDPQRQSNLPAILTRHSTLPVVSVEERERLEPGRVYVVPSNRHVMISDHEVYLEGDHETRPRPSVDLLLSSAAQSYGESLYAVVLTGSGSDGAAGAVEVKRAGGTVIIQNPVTAAYPSMPLSLPPTVVDHVVEIGEVAPLLDSLIRGAQVVQTARSEDPLRELLGHVSRHAGLDFGQYKPSTILRRISRRMAVTHAGSLAEYGRYLETRPDEARELARAFLIKVTGFFRDPEAFAYVRESVVPDLIARGREQGRALRLWSAGCSTGEEPYSLALLLADHLDGELPDWSIKIFATDLDEGAIDFARRGVYPVNVLTDLPDDYLARFFEPVDHSFRVTKVLRQMVIFGQQDLGRGVPFPRIDLVVCRNLLIYFKPELQQTILDLFAYSLHQTGGYLFLGKAETARPTLAAFELVNKKWKIYRCKSGPLTPPLRPAVAPDPFARQSLTRAPAGQDRQQPVAAETNAPELEFSQLRRFHELVLRHLPLGVVVIDRQYRIVLINGAARRLLGIRDILNEQDFLHAARGLPYAQVREVIDTVFREHSPIVLGDVRPDAAGGEGRVFDLTVTLLPAESGASALALVAIADATDLFQTRARLEAALAEQAQLAADLGATNKRLTDLNKELLEANEELQAANEELMLTQEELQATNEEFEATNEELQATNEELETNNEEQQATNEELQTTNDELSARTVELQELARQLTDERVRFAEIVERAPVRVLLLDGPALVIKMYNPQYRGLFEGREALGRSLEEIFGDDGEAAALVREAREAYRRDEIRTTPPLPLGRLSERDPGAALFVHTIVPLHDAAGNVDGVVVYTEEKGSQN
jgi:two-component system, chemotaxis family, CheB/CheR fusion protein